MNPIRNAPVVAVRAFTLVELLAVVAITGVLAGILLLVLGPARQKADDAACLSNLRQVFVALNLYANDNKGKWPDPLSHGSNARFIPVRYYVNGLNSYGSANPNKALDPYITDLQATMCPVVVKKELRTSAEWQYWYGTQTAAPDKMQSERASSTDPFPSLAWCTWPNYTTLQSKGGAPHGGGHSMNVLTWNGAVKTVTHTEWRSGGFP